MSDPVVEKYRDKTDPEHVRAMQAIGVARMMLAQHRDRYHALERAEREMHSFGGMIDPTLYRDMLSSKNFAQQVRMVRAVLAFLEAVDAIAEEECLAEGAPT